MGDASTGVPPSNDRAFNRVVAYHRKWLASRGLLARPWLILGAAPSPTIPSDPPDRIVRAYVKYAGRSAAKIGLPPAHLTFLLQKTQPGDIAGLDLGLVLRMGRKLPPMARINRLLGTTNRQECEITHGERDRYILSALGSLFQGRGVEARPSNGVALICLAVAVGVPSILVAGLSLDSDGYEYDRTARIRRHVEEDRAALQRMATLHPHVQTTEPNLHRVTGLPLYSG